MRALRWLVEQILEESDTEGGATSSPGGSPRSLGKRARGEALVQRASCQGEVLGAPCRSFGSTCKVAAAGTVARRRDRFSELLAQPIVDRQAFADAAWSGVPEGCSRRVAWQILLGYRPVAVERRSLALRRKRREFVASRQEIYNSLPEHVREAPRPGAHRAAIHANAHPDYAAAAAGRSPNGASATASWVFLCGNEESSSLEQIRKDLPRTCLCRFQDHGESGTHNTYRKLKEFVDDLRTQRLMERILFIWSVRHPASGYVQGLNDVLLPFVISYQAERAGVTNLFDGRWESQTLFAVSGDELDAVEADCYHCFTKIMNEVVENYTPGQPGLQKAAVLMRSVMLRCDAELVEHLEAEGVDVKMIALRWLGCLMVRELPLPLCLRLWDTCIAEMSQQASPGGFFGFLIYFCISFVLSHSTRLCGAPFDELMEFVSSCEDNV
eukprot:TRINITY_DN11142_c0_g1_i1.p1 TRINITY_DN11142_c0_g1~~TRINITY_DN11142_c0_g1_i1.p1  ORF type:complete len:441 (-),score=56.08 TRINITY_DN11142_c0_g1_i1:400-1722(-)